ncbi:MAG: 50S ribosomal protein L11 methyltransferase [candidate division Zixibacteria bacterium]|nr:50S ribosomal protein L11 methyltransferase [candidate division Zixibacteria bacterium]
MGVESYIEVSIAVKESDVDAVSNYIIENIATGLLLEDEEGNSHIVIKFYVSAEVSIDEKLSRLKTYLSEINSAYDDIIVKVKDIKDLDWLELYQKSVQPIEIGNNIIIKPPWCEDSFPGKTVITIEPKMAFGTGKHETTRSCLAELETVKLSKKTIFDLGCGSGILGIYAALKGADLIVGYDTDPLAIENSVENFDINSVGSTCQVFLGSIDDVKDNTKYDIVIANIIKKVIVPIVGKLKSRVKTGGIIILSGLLKQDGSDVEEALMKENLTNFSIRRDGEWITYRVQL